MTDNGFTTVDDMELTGEPWLDFVNTGSRLQARYAEPEAAVAAGFGPFGDRLGSYGDLVRWAERTGVVDPATAAVLRRQARARPTEAAAVLAEARSLREALYRIVLAEQSGARGAAADVAEVAEAARAALAQRELMAEGAGYAWRWRGEDLRRVVWPVAAGAVDTLLSEDRSRIRQCEAEDCNWLFRDASRNRSRRWCEMSACGNRAKARRYYNRHN